MSSPVRRSRAPRDRRGRLRGRPARRRRAAAVRRGLHGTHQRVRRQWHDDAAHARPAYFDKIARDGIYIGTDKTERWKREAFREWAKTAFARPVAWAFTPLHRNVRFSPDRTFIWFDEQVRSSMGILQATGVVRPAGASFEIVHYQLSIAVPNDVIPQVTATIKAFESK